MLLSNGFPIILENIDYIKYDDIINREKWI